MNLKGDNFFFFQTIELRLGVYISEDIEEYMYIRMHVFLLIPDVVSRVLLIKFLSYLNLTSGWVEIVLLFFYFVSIGIFLSHHF